MTGPGQPVTPEAVAAARLQLGQLPAGLRKTPASASGNSPR